VWYGILAYTAPFEVLLEDYQNSYTLKFCGFRKNKK
jgi:hypothetical protein